MYGARTSIRHFRPNPRYPRDTRARLRRTQWHGKGYREGGDIFFFQLHRSCSSGRGFSRYFESFETANMHDLLDGLENALSREYELPENLHFEFFLRRTQIKVKMRWSEACLMEEKQCEGKEGWTMRVNAELGELGGLDRNEVVLGPPNPNNSDTTLPMISDLSPPDFNKSDTTLPRVSGLFHPDSNRSDFTLPRMSNLSRPDSNRSDFTLPRVSDFSLPDYNRSDFTLPGFSNLLAPNNSNAQLQNYSNPLVPNNFRLLAPYYFGPIVENYSGVADPRNLRLSIPGHTLNSGPPIPPKLILSQPCLPCSRDSPPGPPCNKVQPCFECVKSNKFYVLYIPVYLPYYQSGECSRDPSNRQNVVAAVQGTKTTAEFIEELRCNHPISHTVPEHELTDQVAAALMAIPSVPDYIFFRYYFRGREIWANDYALVRDLKWGNDDYMELRAFNTHTGLEYHGCMVGWYQKSV
ncbi:hypothetical protein BCON_0115g00060 [Botryotinia convoluta]|uniref:Uncharacterized protein n=1 Tax=Botryotinia convoluta TaxID=54673 RepID=A0A4Z1IAS2_9HELO|nr:hypothetical protein BCON_0115g00060 [Botryotinia convoluta]